MNEVRSRATRDLSGVVVLRRTLLAQGYNDRAIARMRRDRKLHRVRHGAYCDYQLWHSCSRADRHRILARAVLLTAHRLAALSHLSAAIELGMPTYDVDLDVVHLTRSDGRSGRREAGVVQHRGALKEEDVLGINGVRITPPARVAVEMCTIVGLESALVTVNGLLGARLTTLREVRSLASETEHWPHSLTAQLVVRLADGRLESAGESRFHHLCWSQRLPSPQPQVEIRDESGLVVARTDFAWPAYGVFVEFDGREKYERMRRPEESLEEFLMREKAREELICQLTGWVCVRVTWADLAKPAQVAARLRRIFASRRPIGA